MNSVADPNKVKTKLLGICEAFAEKLKEWDAAKVQPGYSRSDFVDSQLDRLRKVVLALLALLSPVPGYKSSSVVFVNELEKYKGSDEIECSLRDFLANAFWTRLYDDLVCKGVGSATLAPELEKWMSSFPNPYTLSSQGPCERPRSRRTLGAGDSSGHTRWASVSAIG